VLGEPPLPEPDDDLISIAVLPFANMSGLAENEYFSDGISEEILNTLVRVDGLSVASRTSAFRYRGAELGIPEIAASLDVRYVLEGSVRRDDGDRVRITAQLIDATTDRHLWSNTYDRQLADIFAVQEEIARAIADELGASLDLGEASTLVSNRTGDATVVERFLRGRELYRQRGVALLEAIDVLEEAVERDPNFAPAWTMLSQTYQIAPDYFERSDDWHSISAWWGRARFARQQARLLAPDDHVVRFYYGWQLAMMDGNPLLCVPMMREALAEDPNNDVLIEDYAEVLLRVGDFQEAETLTSRLREIAPDSAYYLLSHSRTLVVQGRYDEAVAGMATAIEWGAQAQFYYTDYLEALFATGQSDRIAEELPAIRLAAEANADWGTLRAGLDDLEAWLDNGAPRQDLASGQPMAFDGSGIDSVSDFLVLALRANWPINVLYLDFAKPNVELSSDPRFQTMVRSSGLLDYWEEFGFPPLCELVDEEVRCVTRSLISAR